jgi:hypothetical protein
VNSVPAGTTGFVMFDIMGRGATGLVSSSFLAATDGVAARNALGALLPGCHQVHVELDLVVRLGLCRGREGRR